jgi:hypothetical protein
MVMTEAAKRRGGWTVVISRTGTLPYKLLGALSDAVLSGKKPPLMNPEAVRPAPSGRSVP